MDARTRHRMLTTGRSGDLHNLARRLTNHPANFPTKSELRAELAEILPGDEHAAMREKLYGKMIELAEARAKGVYDVMELRGIAQELAIKAETTLVEEDRIVPAGEDGEVTPDDAKGAAQAALDSTTIGGPLDADLTSASV